MAHLAVDHTLVGQTLGHYQIAEKIGAGGMGEVYRAQDEHLPREVAIKVLSPGILASETSRKRFRKEATVLSTLNHPNIATIYDFDTCESVDFLVMEYIPGITLHRKLASGPLAEREVIALGKQLAEGLSAAHEHGVIHLDLKPSNLRLTDDGRLKILDFGLAQLRLPVTSTAPTESRGEMGTIAGTLLYMAPEQLLCGELDARTDIHGVGAVLYEMATGTPRFAEVAPPQLIGAILNKSPVPPTTLNPSLSRELEGVICRCLEGRPENRYQSAQELVVSLRWLERRLDADSATGASPGEYRGQVRPRRLTLPMVSAALALLTILAAFVWHKAAQRDALPADTASIAVLPFADLSSSHDHEYFSDGLAEEILNNLAKTPNLRVVARTSAFQFKGKNEDLRVIGRRLSVDNILEGSVRSDGTRVRINVQLVKANDGFHLWSESYDSDLKDILALQGDISKAVTSALQVKLFAKGSSATLPTPHRILPAAYDDFLRARHFARMGDEDSAQRARDYVTKAIRSDARHAAAYALRASLSISSGVMNWMDYSEAMDSARHDTETAIELDPNLADGYRILSKIQSLFESNCRLAETTMKRARELGPGDADNLGESALIATCLGRQEEAVELVREALALDPLQPRRYLQLGQTLRDLGRHEESLVALAKALELNPRHVWVHEARGEGYLAQGRLQEALQEMEKEPPGFLHDLGMTLAFHALGRNVESNAALAHLASLQGVSAYQIAQAYAYRGEADRAFEWLDRAHNQHDGGLVLLKTDQLLEGLRADARFTQLLERLNLPH